MGFHLSVFEKTLEKSNAWIQDVMEELGWQDPRKAYRALRVVLHALRDHLTLAETVQLGAQLPMLLRGMYFEGWKPADRLSGERQETQFLARVGEYFSSDPEIATFADLEVLVSGVFNVISRHVSAGEMSDVIHVLPRQLREMLA